MKTLLVKILIGSFIIDIGHNHRITYSTITEVLFFHFCFNPMKIHHVKANELNLMQPNIILIHRIEVHRSASRYLVQCKAYFWITSNEK